MRLRMPARRGTAATLGRDADPFEFAHLLHAVSRVDVAVAPDVVPEPLTDVVSESMPHVEPEPLPDAIPEPLVDAVQEPPADVIPEPPIDEVQEPVVEIVPDVVVSRFADSGLDDDRLPVAAKRRRGRRR